MSLPPRDSELVQIVDAAFADAARRAGNWLACRPGCTQCCYGAFAINALDTARLQAGMAALHISDPRRAAGLEDRARAWIAIYASHYPGDRASGILGTSEEDQAAFEEFANDAPCPALDPDTGRCEVYAHRPMTCRVFGPPIMAETENGPALGCCELCFIGAPESEIAASEMHVPHALESEVLAELDDPRQTIVAFALLRR